MTDAGLPDMVRRTALAGVAPLARGAGPIAFARAPGRIDVLGGQLAGAGGSEVAWPTAEGTVVALRAAPGQEVLLSSTGIAADNFAESLAIPAAALCGGDVGAIARRLAADARRAWAGRALLPILCAARVLGRPFDGGLSIAIDSDLPRSAGLASSVALAVAAARAYARLADARLEPAACAAVAAVAEEVFDASADPAAPPAIAAARAGCCRGIAGPAAGTGDWERPLPEDLELRAVLLPDPEAAERAGEAALAAALAIGAWLRAGEPERPLPERVRGEVVLRQGGAASGVKIDPARSYPLRAAAEYAAAEAARVREFEVALAAGAGGRLGAALERSDRAARALGLASRRAVFFADALRERGRAKGVLGVRAARGRGPIVVLAERGAPAARALDQAIAAFERTFGGQPRVLTGSSEGGEGLVAA